jgi:hypothetical protein
MAPGPRRAGRATRPMARAKCVGKELRGSAVARGVFVAGRFPIPSLRGASNIATTTRACGPIVLLKSKLHAAPHRTLVGSARFHRVGSHSAKSAVVDGGGIKPLPTCGLAGAASRSTHTSCGDTYIGP